ncbi:MAG: hypothetical protein AB1598_14685 [Thermodesulfobacteriota bacterium]
MNGDTVRFIRSEGEGLLRELRRELWLNLTGRKTGIRTKGIYGSRRDLLEPEFFLSLSGSGSSDEEERARNRLLSSFLAGAFLGGESSDITDRMLALESGAEFRACGKSLTLRSAKAELLSEPKRDKRQEIEERAGGTLSALNTLCLRKLGILNECSEALGFGSYGALLDATSCPGITRIADEAKRFLTDTDYIARDMLGWFFTNKMELGLKDASIYDMTRLFNSAELRGYFPKPDPAALAKTVVEGMSLAPTREITIDSEKREGKEVEGFSLPLDPPFESALSLYPAGGVHDYESLLGCLGQALSFGYTDPGDHFEFVFLRDESLTDIFSALFGSLVYEPRWLRKYVKIDAEGDFLNFLHLRRLMTARLDAGRAVCLAELSECGDPGELPEIFSDIMSGAAKCGADGRSCLAELLSPVGAPFRFKAVLAGPVLRHFMTESFDEEWWRTKEAGNFMRDAWSRGGRGTAESLLTTAGLKEPDSKTLVRNFEGALR